MAVNTQFSIAVHMMTGLGFRGEQCTTSSDLACSVNATPSFVRRVLAKLSKAGLVKTAKGQGGACWLARPADRISLLDIYRAIGAPEPFAIHSYGVEKGCQVSCNIKPSLEAVREDVQASLESTLAKVTLAQVIRDVKRR